MSTGLAGAIEMSECIDKDDLLEIEQLEVHGTWGYIRLLEELYASGPTHWGDLNQDRHSSSSSVSCMYFGRD